jgi:hypothetical protein
LALIEPAALPVPVLPDADVDPAPDVPAVPDGEALLEPIEAALRTNDPPLAAPAAAAPDEAPASARQPVTVISDGEDDRVCVLLCVPAGELGVDELCAAAPTIEATANATVAPQK